MKAILQTLEKQLRAVEGAMDDLLPPVGAEELDALERDLDIRLPEDFRSLYLWHNGQRGTLFLLGEYRFFPVTEIRELNRASRTSMPPDWREVSDESGVFKDCIANPAWIQFGDNGGNTILFVDMDPGRKGVAGQILEACDGEPECRYGSLHEMLADVVDRIANGRLAWDHEAGSFVEQDAESRAENERFAARERIINDAPDFAALAGAEPGEIVDLVGAIKPNHRTQKHTLYIRGGAVTVVGNIGPIRTALRGGPPLVQVRIRVGKRGLLGVGAPVYEVIACKRLET